MITLRFALAVVAFSAIVLAVLVTPLQSVPMPPIAEPPSSRPPQSLKEGLTLLEETLSPKMLMDMRSLSEREMTMVYYRDFGRGLRNAWALWSGESGIGAEFCAMGLSDAEAMSVVSLQSFWRRLHSQALHVEEQVRAMKEADARARTEWRAARPDDSWFRPSGCPVRDWVD